MERSAVGGGAFCDRDQRPHGRAVRAVRVRLGVSARVAVVPCRCVPGDAQLGCGLQVWCIHDHFMRPLVLARM